MSRWSAEPRVFRLGVDEPPAAEPGTPAWAHAVGALARELDAAALPRKARVACVVPARHARALLVPWNAAMQSRAARQAFAEHCFRDTYGELARDWVVRTGAGGHACPALACAIDAALLDELGRVFAERGLALRSVVPSLVHELAQLGAGLPRGASWIAVPEGDALTLLLLEDGVPRRVCTVRGTPAQLPQLLAREWFALGREDRWAHVELRPRHAAGTALLAEAA